MSAGLPGFGLGGLLFVLSALIVAPVVELVRTLRGRTSPGAWPKVGRQFSIAVAMIVTLDLAFRGLFALGGVLGIGNGVPAGHLTVLPLGMLGITLGLLLSVLVAAKGLQLVLRVRANAVQRRARREHVAADRSVPRRSGEPLDEPA